MQNIILLDYIKASMLIMLSGIQLVYIKISILVNVVQPTDM